MPPKVAKGSGENPPQLPHLCLLLLSTQLLTGSSLSSLASSGGASYRALQPFTFGRRADGGTGGGGGEAKWPHKLSAGATRHLFFAPEASPDGLLKPPLEAKNKCRASPALIFGTQSDPR